MKHLHTLTIALLFLLTNYSLFSQDCNNDIEPPTPVLINGLVFTLDEGETKTINAADFDKASFDNCSENLQFRIQIFGGPILDSIEIPGNLGGISIVKIWVGDEAGNWTAADTYLQLNTCNYNGPHFFDGVREVDVMTDNDTDHVWVSPDMFLSSQDSSVCGGNYPHPMHILKGSYTYDGITPIPAFDSISFHKSEIGTHRVTILSLVPTAIINFQAYVNVLDENGEGLSCNQDTVPPIIYKESLGIVIGINEGLDSVVVPAASLSYFAMDNCSAEEDLQYRVVKEAEADGNLPATEELVVYPEDEQTTPIQLWVGDQSGNWTMHSTYVLVPELDDQSETFFVGGHVYTDLDENCSLDVSDNLISGLTVQAVFYQNGQLVGDSMDVFYTTTTNGYYDFMLEFSNDSLAAVGGEAFVVADTSGLEMHLTTPLNINTGCPGTLVVPVGGMENTFFLSNDFGVQLQPGCPSMYVDIGALFLRSCIGTSHYYINYANYGEEVAESTYVEITFDSLLTVEGSSIPWSSAVGQTYTFPIGDVQPAESESFSVEVSVSCDAVLGQSHCTSAHIYPDTLCGTSTYTGASVAVEGWCDEDAGEVNFVIRNTGQSDMQELSEYIVVEDVIMLEINTFDLPSGQDMMLSYPANGSTYRLEANQVDGHPGLSMPSVAVEACGANEEGTFSLGFVNLYPQDELNPFISIDCQPNIGAFDPNDKQGYPLGVGEEHYISANGQIDYRIRFQNTGTDTAFTVAIQDVLSDYLDISSVRPGASSHPYTFQILEDRTIEFRFDNILLPDSTTNLAASQGFVQFTVMQVQDNPAGAIIENNAAIYFDLNEPVITNTTYHQIGEVVVILDEATEEALSLSSPLKVYPNPFSGQVTFEFANLEEGTFFLYRIDGSLVLQQQFRNDHFELQSNQLPGIGMYFFEVLTEKGNTYSGKLIAK